MTDYYVFFTASANEILSTIKDLLRTFLCSEGTKVL